MDLDAVSFNSLHNHAHNLLKPTAQGGRGTFYDDAYAHAHY